MPGKGESDCFILKLNGPYDQGVFDAEFNAFQLLVNPQANVKCSENFPTVLKIFEI